tara:strand:- start:219 stop:326 length:108 start_codon:yes stop_codon:yes gene_type:complete
MEIATAAFLIVESLLGGIYIGLNLNKGDNNEQSNN